MARDAILHRARTALGRPAGQQTPAPPPAMIDAPQRALEERIAMFRAALEALGGKTHAAADKEDARRIVLELIAGRTAVASNSPLLQEMGIPALDGVSCGYTALEPLREALATADFGITGAEYGLADTGSLVMFFGADEARAISLVAPVHIALLRRERLLGSLDELFTLHPLPAGRTSAMVIITGPSRTADIEMTLVRGIHGPGSIHVVLV